MSARVRWAGLTELKAMLRALPADLRDEAEPIVVGAAEAARVDIAAAYPARTGDLRDGLSVQTGGGMKASSRALAAGALLINRAPHAYIFEHGTQARHTAIGATRGSMPAGNVFIPRVIRHRTRMYEQLMDLLRAHGLTVTGSARG